MKRIVSILLVGIGMAMGIMAKAQVKIDDQRMERDIEIAENVLSTLVKQQMGKRNFFPYEVNGNYTPGYGVTFRLPMEMGGSMIYMLSSDDSNSNIKMNVGEGSTYTYSLSSTNAPDADCEDCPKRPKVATAGRQVSRKKGSTDSLTNVFNQKVIDASKSFIADYGDLIGQLAPEEKIMITNRHEGQTFWYGSATKRKFISLESNKSDLTAYRQGKLTRDQLLAKIVLIDSETSDDLNPDLELLSSIFSRLYRSDLSRSYYSQENIYYERLKNYGVIYYLQVYSSTDADFKKYNMPTVDLEDIDKATRDKKVTELYPVFEKDLKESMLDYGRTLKSLKDEELLVFNVKLTRCDACGIPKTLELSVKNSVLQDFASGKITKDAAVAKINSKKGPNQ